MDQYLQVLMNMYEGVYFIDMDRKITFWNKGAERITGFSANEVLHTFCYDNKLNHMDDTGRCLCEQGCPLHETLLDADERETAVYLHHKEGYRIPVSVRVFPLYEDGQMVGAAEIFVDDTELAHMIIEMNTLKEMAYKDQLTGVYNRRYMQAQLTNKMRAYQELREGFAVALFDLDYFKEINDQHGHSLGDQVLRIVCHSIVGGLGVNDFLGRWGGEEFIVLLSMSSPSKVKERLEIIRVLVENSSVRSEEGKDLTITMSGGASVFRQDDTIGKLIERVDDLLYKAKDQGRNQICFED